MKCVLEFDPWIRCRLPHKTSIKPNPFCPLYSQILFAREFARFTSTIKTSNWIKNHDFAFSNSQFSNTAQCLNSIQNVAFKNCCSFKTDRSGNTIWPQASGFQKLAKLDHFGHFKWSCVHSKSKRCLRLFLINNNTVELSMIHGLII